MKVKAVFLINEGTDIEETNVQAIEKLEKLVRSIKTHVDTHPNDPHKKLKLKNMVGIQKSIDSLKISESAAEHFKRMSKSFKR